MMYRIQDEFNKCKNIMKYRGYYIKAINKNNITTYIYWVFMPKYCSFMELESYTLEDAMGFIYSQLEDTKNLEEIYI